jgi:Ca2+/Na+ antiporter
MSQKEVRNMNVQTSKGLRLALLVYTIYSIVYSLLHVISPELVGAKDPAIERVLGAAVLAFALGAGLAYLERAWGKIKIVVLVQAAWMILYTITMAWGILAGGITPQAWLPTVIGAVFAVLLTTLYIREEKIKQREN